MIPSLFLATQWLSGTAILFVCFSDFIISHVQSIQLIGRGSYGQFDVMLSFCQVLYFLRVYLSAIDGKYVAVKEIYNEESGKQESGKQESSILQTIRFSSYQFSSIISIDTVKSNPLLRTQFDQTKFFVLKMHIILNSSMQTQGFQFSLITFCMFNSRQQKQFLARAYGHSFQRDLLKK